MCKPGYEKKSKKKERMQSIRHEEQSEKVQNDREDDQENVDECGICFTNTSNVTVMPCHHKSCSDCFEKIYVKFDGRCSFCRGPIIRKHVSEADGFVQTFTYPGDMKSFSSYFSKFWQAFRRPRKNETISLHLGNGKHAGITVANSVGGVRVVKVNKKDEAFTCKLKKGNVIKSINGLPAIHHQQVVDIINFSTINNLEVDLSFHI